MGLVIFVYRIQRFYSQSGESMNSAKYDHLL